MLAEMARPSVQIGTISVQSSLVLNPMTAARLIVEDGEPAALRLICFARRRSSKVLMIERATEPVVFAAVLSWLNGRGPASPPDLNQQQKLLLWSSGLMISTEELKTVPEGMQAEFSDGCRIAAALCPQVADLLRDGPITVRRQII